MPYLMKFDPARHPYGVDMTLGFTPMPMGLMELAIGRETGWASELLGRLFKHIGEAQRIGGPIGEQVERRLPDILKWAKQLQDMRSVFAGMSDEQLADPAYRFDFNNLRPGETREARLNDLIKGIQGRSRWTTELTNQLEEIIKRATQ